MTIIPHDLFIGRGINMYRIYIFTDSIYSYKEEEEGEDQMRAELLLRQYNYIMTR